MIYIAHRLFAMHDRALAAYLCAQLRARLPEESIFLPFCDTNEDILEDECKGRLLFELDRARLQQLTCMIAVLHGPSLDDGVCMEIGFAFQIGVPILVMTTDFQTYGLSAKGSALAFRDPLVEWMATEVHRFAQLDADMPQFTNRYRSYLLRNLRPIRAIIGPMTRFASAAQVTRRAPRWRPRKPKTAYIELSPYGQKDALLPVCEFLTRRGWDLRLPCRLGTSAADNHLRAAGEDWDALEDSELLIVDLNGPETPTGAALMIGASIASGRRVFGYYASQEHTFAHGREPNFRNLMIQYSLAGKFNNLDEFDSLVMRD